MEYIKDLNTKLLDELEKVNEVKEYIEKKRNHT
jgi:hypothetical protein